MNEKSLLPILAAVVLFAVIPKASAIPMTYEIGNGSIVTGSSSDPGLVIKTSIVSGFENIAFALDDGQSKTFNFFKIWTDEADVGDDDIFKNKQVITASLDFDVPDEALSLSGHTFGVSGLLQSGKIEWTGPATFTVGDRTFSIALSNEEFNKGLWGLNEGEKYGAYVEATVKQISSSRVSVPDHGSTAMLLGLAFLSFAFIRRRNVTG
jgi:VPDSG-CTERM motif